MEYSLLSSRHLKAKQLPLVGNVSFFTSLIELGAVLRSLTRSVELKNSTDFVVYQPSWSVWFHHLRTASHYKD